MFPQVRRGAWVRGRRVDGSTVRESTRRADSPGTGTFADALGAWEPPCVQERRAGSVLLFTPAVNRTFSDPESRVPSPESYAYAGSFPLFHLMLQPILAF